MKGKIVLLPFPFTNLTASKLRPAVVLFEGKQDVVVAFISSRIPTRPAKTDIVIAIQHPEYRQTGLKTPSVIRLDKVATISKHLLLGEIGELGQDLKKQVGKKVRTAYTF